MGVISEIAGEIAVRGSIESQFVANRVREQNKAGKWNRAILRRYCIGPDAGRGRGGRAGGEMVEDGVIIADRGGIFVVGDFKPTYHKAVDKTGRGARKSP